MATPGLPTTVGTALGALVVTTLLDLSWPLRIALIVVAPACQGRRIGHRLMTALLEGLEALPRRTLHAHGAVILEFDLDGALADIACVTNAITSATPSFTAPIERARTVFPFTSTP